MIGLEHRSLRREQHRAMHRPDQRPEDLHADRGILDLEVAPLAVEAVLVLVRGVDREAIDVDEIGLVDRVGPAQMLVVAVQHEGRAGEEPARDVPALVALKHRLVPRHRAGVGLVRIDEQARRAVGRAAGRDRHAVRTDGQGGLAAGVGGEFLQRVGEAVEERRLEHEAGGDVLARQRQKARLDGIGMKRGVIIHAIRVTFEHALDVGGQVAVVARIDRLPHPHRMDEIVARRRLGALAGRELAARRERHVLDRGEIVLAVREAETEGDVGVGMAEDVRHAVIVAHDARMIGLRLGDQRRGIGGFGLRHPVGDDHRGERDDDHAQ